MTGHTFFCIDGHTCGNPVRVVSGGAPVLQGATMSERRQDFMSRYDWMRRALMFEPRGHDMMSSSVLYPPQRDDCDCGLIYIETTGCLPICGHGTIGTVTIAIEHGLVTPAKDGELRLDTPAGRVVASYKRDGRFVESVRLVNVPSYLHQADVAFDCPGLGRLTCDIAYGGNFYAIIDPQDRFGGLESLSVNDIKRLSPEVRRILNAELDVVHPEDPTIRGISHVMWTGAPRDSKADGRNAVFYGDAAIDRSPCGTGTSARVAQLVAHGRLGVGDSFVHESIIGSLFEAEVLATASVGTFDGIRPAVAGWARVTGLNTIFVDPRDPYCHGFQVL
jgi:4-hydroxyproline epimerase